MNTLRIFIVILCCASSLFGQGVNSLSITRISPTQFQLSWHADTLRPYQIENSPDLFNWTELTGYIEGTNAPQGVLVTKTTDKMFFRLRTGAVRTGFDSQSLEAADDNNSELAQIGFPLNVFPTTTNPGPWSECYVNNNGNLSIGRSVEAWTPLPLQTSAQALSGLIALIAPFWADVDTRPAYSPGTANGSLVVTYGQGFIDGRPAFGVNWRNVGYFYEKTDKLNSFQLVLVDRSNIGSSGDFDAEFNYDQMLWEEGKDSGGVNGYGNKPGRVGITNGVNRTIEAQYSGETLKQLDFTPAGFPNAGSINYTTGLIYRKRNSSVPGRMIFQFRNGNLLGALQVNAGQDLNISSAATTATVTGTASDPTGGAITTLWSVIKNTGSNPVIIANPNLLSTSVTFSAGASFSLKLTAQRVNDSTANASDTMIKY